MLRVDELDALGGSSGLVMMLGVRSSWLSTPVMAEDITSLRRKG